MPAHFTNGPLVASTNVAQVSGAIIWRWLVLFARKWAMAHKVARDTELLRSAPREHLDDIGVNRADVAYVCEYGRVPK